MTTEFEAKTGEAKRDLITGTSSSRVVGTGVGAAMGPTSLAFRTCLVRALHAHGCFGVASLAPRWSRIRRNHSVVAIDSGRHDNFFPHQPPCSRVFAAIPSLGVFRGRPHISLVATQPATAQLSLQACGLTPRFR